MSALKPTYLIDQSLEAFKELKDDLADDGENWKKVVESINVDENKIEAKQKDFEAQLSALEERCADLLELVRNEGDIDTLIEEGSVYAIISFFQLL